MPLSKGRNHVGTSNHLNTSKIAATGYGINNCFTKLVPPRCLVMHAKNKVKNFLFHRVNPVRDELWDPMDVGKFDQCVRYLSKNYLVLTLEEACDKSFSGTPDKPIATISFDDGYRDNLEYAAPILQKYGCPASFYIVTDCIDKGRMVWTQEIKHLFQCTTLLQFNSDLSYLPEKFRVAGWKDRKQRLAYARNIRDFLLTANPLVRECFLNNIRLAFPDVLPLNPMMSWAEVRELHSAGFIIGSHTRTHPVLPNLENAAEIEAEMGFSGCRIQEMLGSYPISMAYPFGAYDQKVSAAAYRTGYKYGVTSNQQWYYSDKDSPYAISRTLLSNEPWIKTLSRMNGSFERIKELIKGKPQHPWKSMLVATKGVKSAGVLTSEALNSFP